MKYEDIVTVATVNFKVSYGDKEHNLKRMCGYVEAAAKQGADILLFPEMCLMGYDYFIDENVSIEEKRSLSEHKKGATQRTLSNLAKRYNIYIIYGASELSHNNEDIYNAAFVVGPEGTIESYRKIHPFDTENNWCKKGDTPFMFDTPWGPVGIGICYDSYQFPELMRYYVEQGVRLYLNPTALTEDIHINDGRRAFDDYYKKHLEYGVICNTIYIASANLVGYDKMNYFGGGSMIIGPKITPYYETEVEYYAGDINNMKESFVMATLDLSLATRRLTVPNPITGTPDYRSDLYPTFYNVIKS